MTDILYEFESQFREKRAIWRLFELAPLRYALARGRVFRWFAINLPLGIVDMQGDIDLMMSLRSPPQQNFVQLYETWEVKVTLISKDGRIKASKSSESKKRQLLGQLKKYRGLGSPCQGLLDLFIYEDEALELSDIPREVLHLMYSKAELLLPEQFGYRVMHFEHDRGHELNGTRETFMGLKTRIFPPPVNSHAPTFIEPATLPMAEPFSMIAQLIENYVAKEISQKRITYGNCVVTFCYHCRGLTILSWKSDHKCTSCGSDLTVQRT